MQTKLPEPEITRLVWDQKYRHKYPDGSSDEASKDDSLHRVVAGIYALDSTDADNALRLMQQDAWVPAGRIHAGAGTNKRVTLVNCLGPETEFLTRQGLRRLGDTVGETFEVLTEEGWVEGTVKNFGRQRLDTVTFRTQPYASRSNYRFTVRATENHRWVLADGSVTDKLKLGDRVKAVRANFDSESEDYKEGIRHGLIFGDGQRGYEQKGEEAGLIQFRVPLFGEKAGRWKGLFEKVNWSPSYDKLGRNYVGTGVHYSRNELKDVPKGGESTDYLAGFFEGWASADGNYPDDDRLEIMSQDTEALNWALKMAPCAGLIPSGRTDSFTQETNFGVRTSPLEICRFRREGSLAYFQVVGLEMGQEEDVFCLTVPSTATFTLAYGLYSGNCFVSPLIEDSMETERDDGSKGIMDALKIAALTQQQGGGIGMDFSTIRPRGALVKRTGSVSSGTLHFMDMWNAMCGTVVSSGSRRGAMMGTLRVDHPDILEFIEAKHKAGRLTNFNVSVWVTDEFMQAVKDDEAWYLHFTVPRADNQHVEVYETPDKVKHYVYEEVRARDLWDKITRSTYEYAEPGILFFDTVNKNNPLNYIETIQCTNPCAEQPLPPNGDCNLGAVNLAVMVKDPFSDEAAIDWELLKETVRVGVRFLDNVIDVTAYPTEDQEREAKEKRRTGLGITGLANLFQQMKIRYGSAQSLTIAREVMKFIRDEAYEASSDLAAERGSFPAFDRDKHLQGPFLQDLPVRVKEKIWTQGLRNGVILTIAPTGTTSLYVGNVSSGCEPSFSWKYYRKMRQPDESLKEFAVEDYGYRLFKAIINAGQEPTSLPDYMVTALDLPVADHLNIQAELQKYVDSSLSKTVNVPEDMPFEDFQHVYRMAHELGCKGCTTYRPSEIRGSVLSTEASKPKEAANVVISERPSELSGSTYKAKWQGVSHAFYITINDHVDAEGRRAPFEIFINSKSVQHQEWIAALTRTISAVLRRGGDVSFLPAELEQVHSADGGQWIEGKYVPSLVAVVGLTLRRHFEKIGILPVQEAAPTLLSNLKGGRCPKCENPTSLIHKEGCQECLSCGYSKCG